MVSLVHIYIVLSGLFHHAVWIFVIFTPCPLLASSPSLSPSPPSVLLRGCMLEGGEGTGFNVSPGHDPLGGLDLLRLNAPETD